MMTYFVSLLCSALTDTKVMAPSINIRVEDVNATSVTVTLGPDTTSVNNVGYTLWHRKADDEKEIVDPTCTLQPPQTRFTVSKLSPSTEYIFKVVSFANTTELSSSEVRVTTSNSADNDDVSRCTTLGRSHSPTTNCSTLSNPSSVEDETNNIAPCSDLNENKNDSYFSYYKTDNMVDPNSTNEPVNSTNANQDQNQSCPSDEEHATGKFSSTGQSDDPKPEVKHQSDGSHDSEKKGPETSLPITPCRLEISKDGNTKNGGPKPHNKDRGSLGKGEENARSTSKKKSLENHGEENLEYNIKVIRWLECAGHIDKSFRQKFLTWYSIRATPQEMRIVKAFVETLIDDPASLAEQLLDTFEEVVSRKRSSSMVPPGFCLKLWH